ncbi:prephenate dehydratase [Candidatus Azobacteroides pseudotrichonymphae]|uniref:prephenate dehydratase n=1 Tax=Azobacteroides pseudotrichonymphae genomovar. CFP2 TaxID=511995 RepID=B6YQG7_AZOPC|nr:prephenate dehydratase [Candidatus Azobacteroides pseudotrichonymphae]BAG83439.1 prephenate dehydratase [Candidatus Azobacteroides pseudotrichonymphae genomovar. CFP2]
MKTVAIQGIAGAYHEIAARKYFEEQRGEKIEILACTLFEDIIAAVKKDPNIVGIMAIENTIAGSLLQNHELIRESDLFVVGEQKIHISHVLAALSSESLDSIKEIESHPIALMQCSDFLRTMPRVKILENEDTALSAKLIAENNWRGHAAICSKYAAELYGLKILEEGIEINKHNFTRFLLLVNKWLAEDWTLSEVNNKASVVFTLPHTHGSLSKVLTIFSFYDVNLTRIQSLPIIGKEWEYLFYIDIIFDNILSYKQSVDAVRPLTNDFKVLGEYKENKMVE